MSTNYDTYTEPARGVAHSAHILPTRICAHACLAIVVQDPVASAAWLFVDQELLFGKFETSFLSIV